MDSAVESDKGRSSAGALLVGIEEVSFVTRRQRATGWTMRQSGGEHHILALATEGRAYYVCDGRTIDVQPGMLLLFRPEQDRSGAADAGDPWSFYSTGVRLRPRDAAAARALEALPTVCRLRDVTEAGAVFDELIHAWASATPGYEMLCHSLVLRLLYLCIRAHADTQRPVPHRRRLEAVVSLLQRRSEEAFRVEDLAELAGLSESRFRVLFKHLTGSSVVQYQNRIRVNKARGLLLSGDHTVTRVAELVGYRDVYYFSRVFKQITGVSPSTLRAG